MIQILVGIRKGADIVPPIPVDAIEAPATARYRLADGTHRFCAPLVLGRICPAFENRFDR